MVYSAMLYYGRLINLWLMKYTKGSFITVPNKEIIRGMKPQTQALYLWLCSYANETGKCFPSQKRLSEDTGMSVSTVIRCVEELIQAGVLQKQVRSGKDRTQSNIYHILIGAKESPEYTGEGRQAGIGEIEPVAPEEKVETDGSIINAVIDEFKIINPSFHILYKQKPQRDAVRQLLKQYGFENTKKLVGMVALANSKAYSGVNFTTPVQVLKGLGKLQNFFAKEKDKKGAKGKKIHV